MLRLAEASSFLRFCRFSGGAVGSGGATGGIFKETAEGIDGIEIQFIGHLGHAGAFPQHFLGVGQPHYDETTGRLTLLFGDTYAAANFSGNWRSNVALYTTQTEYHNGIAFTGGLTISGPADSGVAVQITPGANSVTPLLQGDKIKTPQTHTCIPTGAVMVGETTYLFYMEIDKNAFPPT